MKWIAKTVLFLGALLASFILIMKILSIFGVDLGPSTGIIIGMPLVLGLAAIAVIIEEHWPW